MLVVSFSPFFFLEIIMSLHLLSKLLRSWVCSTIWKDPSHLLTPWPCVLAQCVIVMSYHLSWVGNISLLYLLLDIGEAKTFMLFNKPDLTLFSLSLLIVMLHLSPFSPSNIMSAVPQKFSRAFLTPQGGCKALTMQHNPIHTVFNSLNQD